MGKNCVHTFENTKKSHSTICFPSTVEHVNGSADKIAAMEELQKSCLISLENG